MADDKVLLAHGSGGKVSHNLIDNVFMKCFTDPVLNRQDDAAVVPGGSRLAFTTDSYVVRPIFFPGGDIGKLAICGTVNDISMSGGMPRYVSVGFIIEEGFPIADLTRIVQSMAASAAEAGVAIVTGDTKVVERGGADQIFINTAGIGIVPEGLDISAGNIKPGDAVVLSGSIGDHGVAVMSTREGLSFRTEIQSDCAPLNGMIKAVMDSGADVRALRDPTRGGLASTLNEFASASGTIITIDENMVVIKDQVNGACEMLGLDPYQVANEGKVIAVVAPGDADKVVAAMRTSPYGQDAGVIGIVSGVEDKPGLAGKVLIKTAVGTTRILDMLVGEQLPRIC
jgi:hydrogenase expression/formation protein HypE